MLQQPQGTHILGEHATVAINAAGKCWPENSTEHQARNLLAAVCQCLDLIGGNTAAAAPRAASPATPLIANRYRSGLSQRSPMNPVQRHYGAGASRRPPGDSDSAYWRHEYHRVASLFDRCEVVRMAGAYLESLIRRDPKAPRRAFTEADQLASALVEGRGWSLEDVARRFRLTERQVALARIEAGVHPLSGLHWVVPEHNTFAALAAREMRGAGMACSDVALALGRNAATVRGWTSGSRRAA